MIFNLQFLIIVDVNSKRLDVYYAIAPFNSMAVVIGVSLNKISGVFSCLVSTIAEILA